MTVNEIADDTQGLLRLGGICAIALGVSYLIITGLYVVAGAVPTGVEAWLEYLASQTGLWWAIVGLSVLTDLLFVPVAVALYQTLKGVNKNRVMVGVLLLALFVVLDLAVTWPNYAGLITLSGDFAEATSGAEQAAFVAAASYPASVLESSLFAFYVILVPALAILVIGLVMLQGGRFGRSTAWLGVATGVLGVIAVVGPIFASALDPAVIITAVLTTVWVLVVGYRLLRPIPQ